MIKDKLQTPELEIYHHPEPCCQFVSIHHLHTAEELKASVQIQMPDLFFFVYREPFLPGTDTSVCETRGPHLPWLQSCSPAAICVSARCCGGTARGLSWWQQCVAPGALGSGGPRFAAWCSAKVHDKRKIQVASDYRLQPVRKTFTGLLRSSVWIKRKDE